MSKKPKLTENWTK